MLVKLRLPGRNLIGVNIKLMRQLGQRLVAMQRRHRHFGFERRRVISSGHLFIGPALLETPLSGND